MALNVIVESLDEIPEAIRDEYQETDDGKYVLQLNGAFSQVDRDKLQTALKKERDSHKETRERLKGFGDITPDRVGELEQQIEELNVQLEAAGADNDEERQKKLDELAERRALAKTKPLERQLNELTKERDSIIAERDSLLGERRTSKIVGTVADPGLLKDAGIVPDAVEDIKLWALHNFDVDDDGNVVSKETLGTPGLSPKEVYADLKSQGMRRHWFGITKGAGAGGGKPGEPFGDNPFEKGKFNLTKIGAIVRQDPKKAVRMAKAASKDGYDATKHLPKELRS